MRSLKWVVGAAALASAHPAAAQPSQASASASGAVTVVQPITLVKNTDLAVGALVAPTLGGNTVTIDPTSGLRTISGSGNAGLSTALTGVKTGQAKLDHYGQAVLAVVRAN